ncbi:ubiquinone biosynthesis accessory factor UbiJ [secondary endosymbiont of Ctenarytaina eucalypti]|nr:SCP2 sterol-binding domain-containing protein [secondary endosymbiont of Ctenarytaina eucalypti]
MPLISAILEVVLQHLFYQDRAMSSARERLKGQVFRFELDACTLPVILVFSDRRLDVLNAWDNTADCTVRTSITQLLLLLSGQNLKQLIKQDSFDVEGELQYLQQFVTLLDMAEFDVAELFSPWIGDIAAESVVQTGGQQLNAVRSFFRTSQEWMARAITDEWQVAIGALELEWFSRAVQDITQAGHNLSIRLNKLEGRR